MFLFYALAKQLFWAPLQQRPALQSLQQSYRQTLIRCSGDFHLTQGYFWSLGLSVLLACLEYLFVHLLSFCGAIFFRISPLDHMVHYIKNEYKTLLIVGSNATKGRGVVYRNCASQCGHNHISTISGNPVFPLFSVHLTLIQTRINTDCSRVVPSASGLNHPSEDLHSIRSDVTSSTDRFLPNHRTI